MNYHYPIRATERQATVYTCPMQPEVRQDRRNRRTPER